MQDMRELTLEELDQELAEQLPARDLMCCGNSCCHPCCPPPCCPTICVSVCVNVCL